MNSLLATVICICGIAGLFYLDRGDPERPSKALWLPVTYLLILGSRPVSVWLGITPPAGTNVQLDGSPIDAAVYAVLLAAAIGVLIRRSGRTRTFLAANWPILIYFFYCLVSVTWSYHSGVALKRWVKSTGDLAMVLIVATDGHPIAAIRHLISRIGFILLPTSVLFIKYYGNFGRAYAPGGELMNTGVTTNKNMLGDLILIISLCTLWRVMTLLRTKSQPNRRRHLWAQSTLLAFCLALFSMAHCDTADVCFTLGSVIILAAQLSAFKKRPGRMQVLCLAIFLAGALVPLLGGGGDVAHDLGRTSNFSGRTQIWAALIQSAPNPIIGAGFESFWISPNVLKAEHILASEGWWKGANGLNEAHNGYLEVYLELGLVGVGLIAFILITGYRRAVAAFRLDPSAGSLMLAYIVSAVFYNFTEAGFRMMDLIWIFLLLAIVVSGGIASGMIAKSPKVISVTSHPAREVASEKWAAAGSRMRIF